MRLLRSVAMALAMSVACGASASPYPVVTSISSRLAGWWEAEYEITWDVIDVQGADWTIPHGWTMGAGSRWVDMNGRAQGLWVWNQTCERMSCVTDVNDGETLSEAAMRLYKRMPKSGVLRVPMGHHDLSKTCVGFFAAWWNQQNWDEVVMPGNTCVNAPPADQWCSFVSPEITLDHGVLSVAETSRRTATTTVARCTTDMDVTLVFGSDLLTLGHGVTSKLHVQGADQEGKVGLSAGDNTVTLVSDLSLARADAGVYRGSTVMMIQYY